MVIKLLGQVLLPVSRVGQPKYRFKSVSAINFIPI